MGMIEYKFRGVTGYGKTQEEAEDDCFAKIKEQGKKEARGSIGQVRVTVAQTSAFSQFRLTPKNIKPRHTEAGMKVGDIVKEPRNGNIMAYGFGQFPRTTYPGQLVGAIKADISAIAAIVANPTLKVSWQSEDDKKSALEFGAKLISALGDAGIDYGVPVTIEKDGEVSVSSSAQAD